MREKRAKFVELAEARVSRAIKQIRLIGNFSNRSSYEYNDEDIRQIFAALQRELEVAKSRFDAAGNASSKRFRLE